MRHAPRGGPRGRSAREGCLAAAPRAATSVVRGLGVVRQLTGFLPNIFQVLPYRPLEFRAFFSYYNAICNKETGQLSRADKELIIVKTSLANRCPYSVAVHSARYRVFLKNPVLSDQVCVNWRKSDLPAREKAMLEFALAVS
ncbi:DDB1- and CUL4-associated factor 10 isoform X2 [Camelus bactrianus]|uniref:DDB1- and CUL4-associated factor 10 isoform X2 n=1 Tax=Camelus bactrianus TaxID=9837 RepID=A0AC58Q6Q0_CAMBA